MALQVIEEASIATPPPGTLKPDLAVISQGRVHVVDITVRHEDKGYLEGRKSKINKYTRSLPTLAEQLQVAPGRVLPVVIVTRRAITNDSIANLQDLGIMDRGTYVTISVRPWKEPLKSTMPS